MKAWSFYDTGFMTPHGILEYWNDGIMIKNAYSQSDVRSIKAEYVHWNPPVQIGSKQYGLELNTVSDP